MSAGAAEGGGVPVDQRAGERGHAVLQSLRRIQLQRQGGGRQAAGNSAGCRRGAPTAHRYVQRGGRAGTSRTGVTATCLTAGRPQSQFVTVLIKGAGHSCVVSLA